MSAHPTKCSADSIESYLSGRLTDEERGQVEEHLDSCVACRTLIQDLAADDNFWVSAGQALSAAAAAETLSLSEFQGDTQITVPVDNLQLHTILTPSDDPEKLGCIGSHDVIRVIGHGAMGILLQAYDQSLDRFVAIKILSPSLSIHGSARQRFEREARAAAAVLHPNVIAIHSIVENNGLPYLVMPFVSGGSLQARIEDGVPLSVMQIATIGHQIASGLAAAHAEGLVHRDIKPSNILLEDGFEHLLIADFGLAQAADEQALTRSGVIAGTPLYMSPEQARGETVDARSDLFSLGSLLYTLATGQPAFRAETVYGVLRKITDTTPIPMQRSNAEIPDPLQVIVSRLHAKQTADRFESAMEVADLLQQYREHLLHPEIVSLPTLLQPQAGITTRIRRACNWWVVCPMIVLSLMCVEMMLPDNQSTVPDIPNYQISDGRYAATDTRYIFPTDGRCSYLLTMYAELPDSELQIEGLLTIRATDQDDGRQLLHISNQLQMQRSTSAESFTDDRFVINNSAPSVRSQRINQANGTQLLIDGTGNVVVLKETLELPFGLGSLTGLMLPGAPNETTAVSRNQYNEEVVIQTIMLSQAPSLTSRGTATSTFDETFGGLKSVKAEVTLTQTTEYETRRIPVRVSFVRLDDEERAAWQASRGTPNPTRNLPPFSPTEEAKILTDLANNQRILHWLDELEGRDPVQFSDAVVDAIVALQDHTNPSFATLATRIVRQIPETRLNPFREVEHSQ